jgi:outer membrane protein OmpA-like peptidoglycan-associated protein
VRVHDDTAAHGVANWLGANAVTVGNDIFFANGRYAPETAEGENLLAHELAHVAQQGGEPRAVQCDLAQSMPVTLGVFDINMITQAGGGGALPGMRGTISFDPDPDGPYSSEIGLIQAINITDVAGATNPASGMPVDWRNVTDINTGVPGTEAGRMEMMTPGTPGGAPAGWYIDSLPSATPRGNNIGPNYIEHFGRVTQFGWLRSPTDVGPATLFDFPSFSFDVNFDFETVAKGTDNQVVYGSLFWGFNIRSGAVVGSSEYAMAVDNASPVFEEALERFRGYYVHEPILLYFDTGDPIPRAGEDAKLAGVVDYLDRYPDVMIEILGFADIRGSESSNLDLSQQRADAAANLLLLEGVDASRIDASGVIGLGETQEFSQHGTAPGATQPITEGRLQANRRAVIRFVHTASNHPLVMP